MADIVADTHAIIWYLQQSKRLSGDAYAAFDRTASSGGCIYIASISIVEIHYLVEGGKLPEEALVRLDSALDRIDGARVAVVPLDLHVAHTLKQIPRDTVPEMPDRIIAATALYLGLPLVTRDRKIRESNVETIW